MKARFTRRSPGKKLLILLSLVAIGAGRVTADRLELAGLQEAQGLLAENQALLSFHFAPDAEGEGGGARLIAVTREELRAYPLAKAEDLLTGVELFRERMRKRDSSEASVARHLHADLLDRALSELPQAVDSLILIPDAALHDLPFARLLDAAGQPLAWRYALSRAPSAAVWASRYSTPSASAGGVLLVAPGSSAIREAKAIQRRFAGRVLEGPEAAETALEDLELARFNILHFAAGELVSVSRLTGLDLKGKLVVLGKCDRDGEGVLGGRAFLEAGASSVVACHWPLGAGEAVDFFADFYGELANGVRVASALGAAQKKSRRRSEPAALWAGFSVFGDGEAIFESRLPPLQRWILRILSALVVIAMLVGSGAIWWLELRRRVSLRSPWSRAAK